MGECLIASWGSSIFHFSCYQWWACCFMFGCPMFEPPMCGLEGTDCIFYTYLTYPKGFLIESKSKDSFICRTVGCFCRICERAWPRMHIASFRALTLAQAVWVRQSIYCVHALVQSKDGVRLRTFQQKPPRMPLELANFPLQLWFVDIHEGSYWNCRISKLPSWPLRTCQLVCWSNDFDSR